MTDDPVLSNPGHDVQVLAAADLAAQLGHEAAAAVLTRYSAHYETAERTGPGGRPAPVRRLVLTELTWTPAGPLDVMAGAVEVRRV